MVRIRRFGVVQTANVVAALYAVIIVIVTIPIAVFVAVAGRGSGFGDAGAVVVLVGGLAFAVFYAIVGWIIAALAAVLYNWVAGRLGGIQILLETVSPPAAVPPPTWGGPPPSTTQDPPAPAPAG